jgi:hypothetical protein
MFIFGNKLLSLIDSGFNAGTKNIGDRPMSVSKKKCRQYNVEYLKYGFIQASLNKTLPM